jgi:voltage-gated sodium channel
MRQSAVPAAETQVAKRLSKEAAQVLTPAGKRQLDKSKPRKKIRRSAGDSHRDGLLTYVVVNPSFDLLCAFMIILNSALIGYEIDWRTMSDSEPPHTDIINYVCAAFFFFELVLRMLVETPRGFFLMSENRSWNTFDFALVAMSFVDILLTDIVSGSVSQGLRTLKMLRIIRVCRVFRFFAELSQLAMMIVDSIKSLCWALIMLFIVIYVFAILFTHAASDHVRMVSGGPDARQDKIVQHFGSLGTTIYTLFHSMLNGISWYVLTDALMHLHPTMFVLYLFYIAFTMLAVLNIITGVFVDNAVEAARTQREFLVQKEMELKEKWCEEMRNLFLEMDEDCSGAVSLREVAEFFKDERVWSYFQALGIEAHDAERLFSLLDEDGSGDISVDEFLSGCLRLKGSARSIDVYALLHDQRRLASRFCAIEEAQEAVCGALHVNSPLPRGLRAASKFAGTGKSFRAASKSSPRRED